MCNKAIIPFILNLRKGEQDSFLHIYKVFENLINYYNSRMCCEDGKSELTLFLLELLHRFDLSNFEPDESFSVQKYIAVALRNKYIDISKKGREDVKRVQFFGDINIPFFEQTDEKAMLHQALAKLNLKQRRVLEYKYFYGYSDAAIAKRMGITRQAVNGIKLRAFDTLKILIKN